MLEMLKIICYISSILSVIGLIIMNSHFIQEKKNTLQRLERTNQDLDKVNQDLDKANQNISNINKNLETHKFFASKDVTGWVNRIKDHEKKFKDFESEYIIHQYQVNERLEKLEKND
jgi:uncharacterized protein YpuA (DUF1002 family)